MLCSLRCWMAGCESTGNCGSSVPKRARLWVKMIQAFQFPKLWRSVELGVNVPCTWPCWRIMLVQFRLSWSSKVLAVSCSVWLGPLTKSFYPGCLVSPANSCASSSSALQILLPSWILILNDSYLVKTRDSFLSGRILKMFLEFPLWLSGLRTRLVSVRMWVLSLVSLSGLRIWRCCKLWPRLQCALDPMLLWLWCRLAAAA